MELTEEIRQGLGVALNEATLVAVTIDQDTWAAYVTLAVLTLPESGPGAEDNRILLVLKSLGRIAASLRLGLWNDEQAPVESFPLDGLSETVESFNQLPIYGWECIYAPPYDRFEVWADRLSLDVSTGIGSLAYMLELFQADGGRRHLDVWLWFDLLEVRDPSGAEIPLNEFIAGGRRWWDALYARDPRTAGSGIIPLGE